MVTSQETPDRKGADPFTVALEGLSLEIGVHDLDALDRNRNHLPEHGRIYVNAVAGEGAEARINIAAQLRDFGFRRRRETVPRPLWVKCETPTIDACASATTRTC